MELDRKVYFIREHVGMLKLSNTYDILDPETQEQLAVAKEEPGTMVHLLRIFINKKLLPTQVTVYSGDDPTTGRPLLTIKRGMTFFRSKVSIHDGEGNELGHFLSKMISLGPSFRVFDADKNEVAIVKGDWKGWNFKFMVGDEEIGSVTKKWSGFGKELFTSADNYIIALNSEPSAAKSKLLLAAGLSIDTIFKE